MVISLWIVVPLLLGPAIYIGLKRSNKKMLIALIAALTIGGADLALHVYYGFQKNCGIT